MTDLDELERLARRTNDETERLCSWTKKEAARLGIVMWLPWIRSEYREDIADFVLAASPDVVLDIIARVRAAEAERAAALEEVRAWLDGHVNDVIDEHEMTRHDPHDAGIMAGAEGVEIAFARRFLSSDTTESER